MKITVNIKPFGGRITVLVGEYDEIKRHIPKDCDAFGPDGYVARCYSELVGGGYPCFDVIIHSRTYAISVLAHEVLHGVSDILDMMGETPVWASEVQAYMLQYVLEEIEKKLESTK